MPSYTAKHIPGVKYAARDKPSFEGTARDEHGIHSVILNIAGGAVREPGRK